MYGSSKGARGGWGFSQKKNEILGSEKCILVDFGDGFAMDNRESKKPLRSDRGSGPPDPPPVSATVTCLVYISYDTIWENWTIHHFSNPTISWHFLLMIISALLGLY